ncbi:MAG: hypothetical protein IJJ69_11160, partial [Oscillospiraceae bacterium]|nr:hypothetical protein [Oscillospiraceae bacterium]
EREILKKINFSTLMLCPVMLLSGCAQTPQEAEPVETAVVYQALPLPDLFVSIPENYETTSSDAYKEYYVCEDASIIITEDTREVSYPSAYDYSVNALNEYQKVATSLQFLNSEVLKSGCPYSVQTLEFNYELGEGAEAVRLTCLAGYLTDGASMYIITCKSNTDTYQTHRNEFVQVMNSAVIARN